MKKTAVKIITLVWESEDKFVPFKIVVDRVEMILNEKVKRLEDVYWKLIEATLALETSKLGTAAKNLDESRTELRKLIDDLGN